MCLKDFAVYSELESEKIYLKLLSEKIASLSIKKNVMKQKVNKT